jgi:hypothetical protein
MLAEDVKVDFAGFEPSYDVRSALDILLSEIHLKSPHQSLMEATFTLTNGIFEGVLKITSQAQNFVAKGADSQVADMGQKLMENVISQLDKWKSLRFE